MAGLIGDRLAAALDVQLLIDVMGVLSHSARRDDQLLCNLLVGQPLRQKLQDFKFAVGQGFYQPFDFAHLPVLTSGPGSLHHGFG